MPTLQFKKELSMSDLLNVVEQLSGNELEEFIARVQALRVKKLNKKQNAKEQQFIQIIERNFNETEQQRYNELVQKRQQFTITEEELSELLEMNDYVEQLAVERVKALGQLSKLTGKSVDVLMKELDVKPRSHV